METSKKQEKDEKVPQIPLQSNGNGASHPNSTATTDLVPAASKPLKLRHGKGGSSKDAVEIDSDEEMKPSTSKSRGRPKKTDSPKKKTTERFDEKHSKSKRNKGKKASKNESDEDDNKQKRGKVRGKKKAGKKETDEDDDDEETGRPQKKSKGEFFACSKIYVNYVVLEGSPDEKLQEVMKGVVFALSGFVNPERSELREKALEMGAKYHTDWTSDCTHLM